MTATPQLPAAETGPDGNPSTVSEKTTAPESVFADLSTSKRKAIVDLSLGVALPTVGYYGAKALGLDDYQALLIGTLISTGRVVYLAVRSRRLDAFAAFMMIVYGVGVAASLISGDARLMLAKDSLGDGLPGVVFLISCLVGRPFSYYTVEGMVGDDPAKRAEIKQLWATSAGFRRTMRQLSLVWGAVLLGFSLLRLPLVYLLPINVMAGASSAAYYAVLVGLTVWAFRFGARRAQLG